MAGKSRGSRKADHGGHTTTTSKQHDTVYVTIGPIQLIRVGGGKGKKRGGRGRKLSPTEAKKLLGWLVKQL